MQIKLIDKPSKDISPKVQCCLNRKVPIKDIPKYLSNTYEDIYPPETFGEDLLISGVKMLVEHIKANHNIFVVVDSDVDGFTSAAIFINYLHKQFPAFTENYVDFGLHPGKGHGLTDFIDALETSAYSLVICPDSATNDIEQIERLHNVNTDVLILDHHLSEVPFSPYSIVINSQYHGNNKELSGAGVVLKFCQYMDTLLGTDVANDFKDLAAVGLQSDMMSITELETKEMIFEGLRSENIKNPLINAICTKNEFAMTKADYAVSPYNDLMVSPMAISFFCTPLLNAVCRSGTQEEKELTFKAMLTMYAFKEIPSTKRGHKLGEMETILTQMTRQITNIKNRQERAVTAGMELLEAAAVDMMEHKTFVFALDDGDIEPNIRGLCANKLMAKYQRPVAVTSRLEDGTYAGSMRGYTATGINNFKAIAEKSKYCTQVIGHSNAAGIFLTDPGAFVDDMDKELANISTDIVYYVDYIFNEYTIDPEVIIALAELNDYLGQNFSRPQVFVENIKITNDNFKVMKSNTGKIDVNGISIMLFGMTDEQIETFTPGTVINFVCKCNINEWNWQRNPQLISIDYEIIDEKPLNVTESWGF